MVPVDTAVILELASTDVVHTWDVPDLAPKRDAVPDKPNRVVFRADREGTYMGQSSTLSGQGYAAMRTEVDVVSPQAYLAFIKRQKAEVQAAQNRVVGPDRQREGAVSSRPRPELVVDGFPRAAARAGSSWRPAATTRTSGGS